MEYAVPGNTPEMPAPSSGIRQQLRENILWSADSPVVIASG
jgi:hypothetical protein